jgi:hypothetical protein
MSTTLRIARIQALLRRAPPPSGLGKIQFPGLVCGKLGTSDALMLVWRRHQTREGRRVAIGRRTAIAIVRAAGRIIFLERPVIDVIHVKAVAPTGSIHVAGLHRDNQCRAAIGHRLGILRRKHRAEQISCLRGQFTQRHHNVIRAHAGAQRTSQHRPAANRGRDVNNRTVGRNAAKVLELHP